VEELATLDQFILQELSPVYGLIFLFKWRPGEKDERPTVSDFEHSLYFANQVINNACATQAIVSVLLNCPHIDIGPELGKFKELTKDFDSHMKGLALSNVELIRQSHNSFARPEPIVMTEKPATNKDDVYHFIAYLPFDGILYELDGLKKGPIIHGVCTEQDWLQKVTPVIKTRIETYAESEIHFNLMAIVKHRKQSYTEQLELLNKQKESLESAFDQDAMSIDGSENSKEKLLLIDEQIATLNQKVLEEDLKFKKWKVENVRRRHNYIPFLFNLLKVLAEKGKLEELIKKAEEHHKGQKAKQ